MRKVEEYIQLLGTTQDKAIAYIISKRKSMRPKQAKTSYATRVEFKMSVEEKEELMNIAKQKGISLSEMLREVVKKLK